MILRTRHGIRFNSLTLAHYRHYTAELKRDQKLLAERNEALFRLTARHAREDLAAAQLDCESAHLRCESTRLRCAEVAS